MSGSTTELRVELPAGLTVMSLRDYLQKQRGLSHTLWKRLKHSGTLRVNGEPVIAVRAIVHDGDHVSYDIMRKSDIVPEPLPLDIRYEDDDLLIVNKPAGMLVHPTTQEGHGTLGNAVLAHFASRGEVHAYHPIHRLDRDTSGLVLIAKQPEIQYQLSRGGTKHFTRDYLAIIAGHLTPASGIIDAPIARSLPSIILRKVSPDGQEARTHYRTLRRYQLPGTAQELSLLCIRLDTGRTHQIRVHLAHLGHPLLGDDLYGGSLALIPRQALHACRLQLMHPRTGLPLDITAPLPEDMQALL